MIEVYLYSELYLPFEFPVKFHRRWYDSKTWFVIPNRPTRMPNFCNVSIFTKFFLKICAEYCAWVRIMIKLFNYITFLRSDLKGTAET